MYMYIVYCILYIDIADEINNSIIYFVQTNYSSCCSYLKYHFLKYLILNAHGINNYLLLGCVSLGITVCLFLYINIVHINNSNQI